MLEGHAAAAVVAGMPLDAAAAKLTRARLAELDAQHDTVRPHLIAHGADIFGEMSAAGC